MITSVNCYQISNGGYNLPPSESYEHKRIKTLIYGRLKEWIGATLQEYPSSGHELDNVAATLDGISIYVEAIWSGSFQNFLRDMIMISNSDANIKLVVVSPEILKNEKCQREFGKIAIAQRKLGFAMHGDLIDGTKIIEDSNYLETEFKEIIFDLMSYVRKHGKVVGKQAEFQPPEPRSADVLEEKLLSNLFPVIKFPSIIFSSPTTVRKVAEVYELLGREIGDRPFLPKNKRIYAFDNLKDPSSLFLPIVSKDEVVEEQSSEWYKDPDRRNDLIYLFNLALQKFCKKRGMDYDKKHDRFVCLLKDGKDNTFTWKTESRFVKRKIAKRVFNEKGDILFCTHYAASLRFMAIDEKLFLKIEPTKTFTSDGYKPIRINKLASLMSRYLSKEYNSLYLNHVRFWAKYLSKLDVKISVPAGEQVLEVSTSPIATSIHVGIADEKPPSVELRPKIKRGN